MRYLQTAGYTSISLSDFVVCGDDRSILPERPVVITFDDGLASHYTIAYPILRKYGLTATFFVRVGLLGQPGNLSLDQLRLMHQNGMAIESHSLTHPFLTQVTEDELKRQLVESKRLLGEKLGGDCQFISIPEGIYSNRVLAMVKESGYAGAATSDLGMNRVGCDLYRLNRIGIHRGTTTSEFSGFLMGRGLLVRRWIQMALVVAKKLIGLNRYEWLKAAVLGRSSAGGMSETATGRNGSEIRKTGFDRVSMSERREEGERRDESPQIRVLFIPLEASDPKTNERSATLIRIMLRRYKLIGIRRVPYSEGSTKFITYLKYVWFALAVFCFGIRNRRGFDLIFCEHASYGLGAAPLALVTGKPLVLDCHAHARTYGDELNLPRFQTFFRVWLERMVGRVARVTITVSEADKGLFVNSGFSSMKVAAIPTAADFSVCDRRDLSVVMAREKLGLDMDKKIILFIGKRAYKPNFESAQWINQHLAPAIAQRFDAVILLSGTGPIPVHPNKIVRVTGFVPDIYELIVAADVCVAPVWKGVGIMTKVIDTMACGKPNVVSRFCTQGIPELADGENAMIADTTDEFVEKTIYLLEHPDEAQRLGRNARKTIEEYYNWHDWEGKLNEILVRCLEKGK
jgi:glycosyltransferase involved in cell wall biosynthesis